MIIKSTNKAARVNILAKFLWTLLWWCLVPVLKDSQAPGGHAVDTPVRDPVLVADANTEPSIVGSHDLDHVAWWTRQIQRVPLTRVWCLHRAGVHTPGRNWNGEKVCLWNSFSRRSDCQTESNLQFSQDYCSLLHNLGFYGNFYAFFTCTKL